MSKLMLFDYECPACGQKAEALVHSYDTVECHCGTQMQKQISAVRIDRSAIALSPSASPESVAHFDRIHRERRAIEEKSQREHGDYGKAAGSD
jgi:putative FmdB family regulatory protein